MKSLAKPARAVTGPLCANPVAYASAACLLAVSFVARGAEPSGAAAAGRYVPTPEELQAGYRRAQRPPRPLPQVPKSQIKPHWFDQNARFWYRNDLRGGAREFVLVDVERGRRRPAFDHDKLAAALSQATGRQYQGNHLPFDNIEFGPGAASVRVKVDNTTWQIALGSYGCTKVADPTDPDSGPGNPSAEAQGEAPELEAEGQAARSPLDPPLAAGTSSTGGAVDEDDEGPNPRKSSVSPDGKWTAFVKDYNLYVRSAEGHVTQLSRDGKPGLTYGLAAWAPDSKTLAAFRVEPGDHKEVYLVESSPHGGGRARLHKRPYDLPGDKLIAYELNVFHIDGFRQVKPPVERVDLGFPRLRWSPDGSRLTFEKVDRGHQRFRLIEVDARSAAVRNLIDEKSETFIWTAHTEMLWLSLVTWLTRTDEVIYVSERDGWRHLYLVDAREGRITNQITRGEWAVRAIDRIDEDRRQIWFRAGGKNPDQDPYLVHSYRVNFDGTDLAALTEGNGNHTVQFSPDRKYLIDSYSRVDMAPVHELRRAADGKLVCPLEKADTTELEAAGWQPPEVFVAKGRDGKTDIWGVIARPRSLDPARKYPVIESIYAGPQGSFVPKSFNAFSRYAALTELGFIVVQIDGMGTANRSKAFHDVCWHNLKDAGFPDRIAWHKAVAQKYPYYDLDRVGVYGTSAGGQNAAGALLFHPEFYKAAVAACGCHDNRMDKASWNEQWMGYPVGPQYADCSNITHAANLRGRLLLIVGELDDNVPPESTYRFADALIKAGKDFEFLVVPGMRHSNGGAYGVRRMQDFFVRHLHGIEPPDRNAVATARREPIIYTVSFPEPAKHYARVEMLAPASNTPSVELMMAEWSPGFYRVEHYANRVEDVSARTPDGKPLAVEQPRKNRWRVRTEGAPAVVVSYRLRCEGRSVTTNWVSGEYALLNGPATFLTFPERGPRPHEVRIELPAPWKGTVTALDPAPGGNAHHYRAEDFDTLADSPIVAGNPTAVGFEVAGSKHVVAGFGDVGRWDAHRTAADLEKLARENLRLWGFLPFRRYTYLCAFRRGGGGLEHKDCSLLTTDLALLQNTRGYLRWLSFVSHEYFHAYNAKRLRPAELGVIDYENAPRTSGLWVAEGLTCYYDDLLVTRAGLAGPQDHLNTLSAEIKQLQKTPGRRVQSLEQASLDVWTTSFSGIGGGEKTVSYYVKGPVVGFLLDARIRRATGGSRSLDHVMRLAYQRYSGERGFSADQFRATAEEVAGVDLKDWFRRAVSSTEELDYAEALDWFGLRFAPSKEKEPTWRLEVRPDARDAEKSHLAAWLGAAPPAASPPGGNPAEPGRPPEPPRPAVVSPPESFLAKVPETDREAARKFYTKYLDIKGLPVLASAEVADQALERTYDLVTHLLAGRPDVLEAMLRNGTRLIIIGKDQVYTDMPEYRNHPNPAYQNERVRGTGGFRITSFGEENLLNLPLDRYDDESIAVHEFCHTIDAAVRRVDPTWQSRLLATYHGAMEKGLWKNAYTATDPAEYWAEICQSYFDCNRVNNWNHAAVGTREQLKMYDPEGYELVKTTFRLTAQTDWRYRPLRRQPSVTPPPGRFRIDPYYTKFTYAREFIVLGSGRVSDEALLKANDMIRKMFAYRQDILKAMIAEGARLVVLGRGERLSDLPEFADAANRPGFDQLRYCEYDPDRRLMVVPEENVLGLPGEPFAGKCMVVSVFAKGLYSVAGLRPVDHDFERRRDKQQYELRVKRLDVEFDRRLAKLHDQALAKALWKGTAAARSRAEYWAAGVEAYFDAAGDNPAPNLADRPINTREALRAYDPDLYALVDETMAFRGHVDWRYRPAGPTRPDGSLSPPNGLERNKQVRR
jgi:predicted metalloprotease with PDZ domain/dipeptidyl aminopeptidase/acylaminoacyl peptidase